MKKEILNKRNERHDGELTKRYGITNYRAFRTAARRYELKLHRLFEIACSDSERYIWAESMALTMELSARRNLAKYCRFSKKFNNELWINKDPRGYALKLNISGTSSICQDWGGNKILAPNYNELW